jgi:creatinine amidohydrolase
VRAVSRNGVLGDPTGASADEGHDLFNRLAAQLVDEVAAWRPAVTA